MENSFLNKPNYIRIYGHRGARGDIVENSIEGFKYTFDLGIKAIEFDVLISKDNIPVLFHDYTLNTNMVKDENCYPASHKGNPPSSLTGILIELIYLHSNIV